MNRFVNQRGLLDEKLIAETRFAVVGAGAIGSFFVTMLSKMGGRLITVCDFDRLENHNFANQLYPLAELGKPKVDALKSVALQYGDATITAVDGPFNPETAGVCDVFVSAVDNMDVRRSLWDFYKTKCRIYVDGRMSALVYKCFVVDTTNPEAVAFYESTLHTQAEAAPEPCGQKSIIFTVALVAAQMLSGLKKALNNEYRPTMVQWDAFNDELVKVYHMEQVMETFVAEEEPEPVMEQITPEGV